jgi:hypothetical protein
MAIDAADNLYIADTGNSRIRMVAGLSFPIRVPLPNSAPGPVLINDADVAAFTSAGGVSTWYFGLSKTSSVTFHYSPADARHLSLHPVGTGGKVIENPDTVELSPGDYFLESKSAGRVTITPQSVPTAAGK